MFREKIPVVATRANRWPDALFVEPQAEEADWLAWHVGCKEMGSMKARFSTLMIVAASLAVCGAVRAADNKAEKPAADVKAAMDQFSAKRDAMLKDRQALFDQLKNATDEQRKAILAQMKAQEKDMLETQRALGRQIRDELRKLRQGQPAGGSR